MKVIAVLSQKGGAGKTTLALHLAVAAERDWRPAAVIDLDPQGSAAGWADTREAPAPAVVSAQAARLPAVLAAARENGAQLALIDSAPHSESAALAAARAADLVLIPCRPSILDLRAIGSTLDVASLAGTPAAVVINAAPPGRGVGPSALTREAMEAVAGLGAELAPVVLVQRSVYGRALTGGLTAPEFEPGGKAAVEVAALYAWTRTRVGL